jgi:GT2 family glycosyltransferase
MNSLSNGYPKISVIIVNFNSSKNLTNLLKTLLKIKESVGEIIVIDNHSRDLCELIVPKTLPVKIIKNDKNLGFARAVNQGLKKTLFQYSLLINPDCEIPNKSILKTLKFIQDDDSIGIIGGKILDFNGNNKFTANARPNFLTALFEFTNLKKLFKNNRFTNRFWIEKETDIKVPTKVSSVCGAYMIINNNHKILFNESYFLYLEDVDIGITVNDMNLSVYFDPRSYVNHIGGQSSNSKYGIVLKHWYKSRKILFKRILPKLQGYIINLLFSIEEQLLKVLHKIRNEPIN